MPEICEKYAGAGKIAIWTDDIPSFDINKFAEAVATPRTINGNTYYAYDENGNKITKVNTAIDAVTKEPTDNRAVKYLQNGKLVIEKNGKLFSAIGARIK